MNLGYIQKYVCFIQSMSYPGGTSSKESACQCRRQNTTDSGSIPGWEDPLELETATHASILAW